MLLFAWAAYVVWLADRRKSEVLALFAVGLAFYSSVITHVGLFTLYSNLILTIAAVFFLVRNRWATLSVATLAASYGGYATLMGLINNPELFRCGVEWAGVTDINLMYSVTWSDFSEEWQRYGMPVLVGDRVKDAAQLKATSPIEQAARIKQPLLLAHGGSDRRVPLTHGTQFYDAVKVNNSNVEWVIYPEEGHGWRLVKTRLDFWTRVEKFLDHNIGAP